MLICDTNVLSEVMRTDPNERVVTWLDVQNMGDLWTTAITRTELHYGIQALPAGIRRDRLARAAATMFAEEFSGRILSFDVAAADACADVRVLARQAGKAISREDAMIAGIAKAHNGIVVTRDEGGFQATGVTVINPWSFKS